MNSSIAVGRWLQVQSIGVKQAATLLEITLYPVMMRVVGPLLRDDASKQDLPLILVFSYSIILCIA